MQTINGETKMMPKAHKQVGGQDMKRSLLVLVLLAVILAMAVPLTNYWQQSNNAFTYNNLISINPGINH